MEPKYVFIVGLPRTGTKLMMNVLENCQDRTCRITPENFFLGRAARPGVRRQMKKIGDMSIDANVQKFVDDMYAGKFFGDYWKRLADGRLKVEKEVMYQKIVCSDRTDRTIYSILLQIHTDAAENAILGDKTGAHLYHVPTLVEWFPEAKIVHTFRDPRAVLASEHKKLLNQLDRRVGKLRKSGRRIQATLLTLSKPFYSLLVVLYVTIAWLSAARLNYKYKKLYPANYYLSKFEDLINSPEESVKRLCQFLDIEFHSAMLNPPKIDSSYAKGEGSGFDKQTLDRWQAYIKPWMQAGLLLFGKKYLKEFGYIR